MSQPYLCDQSNAYNVAKETIRVRGGDVTNRTNRIIILKKWVPCTQKISQINNFQIRKVKDLGIVMSMYNLLEYSKNHSKIVVSLWQ